MRRNTNLILIVAVLVLALAPACSLGNLFGSQELPTPTPSRTPKPTFTPTLPITLTPIVAPTDTPTPPPTPTPVPTPTFTPAEPPTPVPTPTSETAQVVVNNATLNVRSGPGTNYPRIGQVHQGDRFEIKGKNRAGTWWQIDFNGRDGWVSADYVRTEGNVSAVQVAANIPTPPPTPTPRPTQPPAPTPTPKPQFPYSYVQGSMASAPNCGTVYMEGKVVDAAGNPINGVTIELEFFGNRDYRVTGVGKPAGAWGFSPLARDMYQTAVPFNIRVVESQANPTPLSDVLFIDFRDCNQAGQFTNITFRKN